MIIGEHNILLHFYFFNEEYFGGILPIPNIKIRHGWHTLGYFHCNPDAPLGTSETIEMTDFYDYTDDEFRDILIHEMIHYYLYYIGEDTRVRHGKAFKKMANEFNLMYGTNVTVKVDISMMKPNPNAGYFTQLSYKLFH